MLYIWRQVSLIQLCCSKYILSLVYQLLQIADSQGYFLKQKLFE